MAEAKLVAGLDMPEVVNNNQSPSLIWEGTELFASTVSQWASKEKQAKRAALIVRAVNDLPKYERLAEVATELLAALRQIVEGDNDPEVGLPSCKGLFHEAAPTWMAAGHAAIENAEAALSALGAHDERKEPA